jgi:hypothetical protein
MNEDPWVRAYRMQWDGVGAVRMLEEEAVSPGTPGTLEGAILQLNHLRAQLSESRQTVSLQYTQLREMERERNRYRRGYESLREVLPLFEEDASGWYQSPKVPVEDYRAWQADAGL